MFNYIRHGSHQKTPMSSRCA